LRPNANGLWQSVVLRQAHWELVEPGLVQKLPAKLVWQSALTLHATQTAVPALQWNPGAHWLSF
jgi:hypothetical protein